MSNIFGYFSNRNLQIYQAQNKILETNAMAEAHGLRLSAEDARMLAEENQLQIVRHDRIEFGDSITPLLIESFLCSSYLAQADYAETMTALLEIFYTAKEECCDLLTDHEVIDLLYHLFEDECGGSIELLQNSRQLAETLRAVRDNPSRRKEFDT